VALFDLQSGQYGGMANSGGTVGADDIELKSAEDLELKA
jgi:hypothetical protein